MNTLANSWLRLESKQDPSILAQYWCRRSDTDNNWKSILFCGMTSYGQRGDLLHCENHPTDWLLNITPCSTTGTLFILDVALQNLDMRPPVRWGEYWLPCCAVARELERPGISMSCLKDSECLNTHYVPAVQNEKQLQCWQRSMWTPVLRLPPTLGIWPSPPACCLPDPSNTTNSTPPLFHPTHIIPEKLFPPSTTSPLFHIPGGALVKSNPIIRLSAVPEKKELSPRFFFGLPFLFPPSFLLQVQARRHFGPFWPVAFVFLQTWFIHSLSSVASFYLFFLCFFFFNSSINFCPGSEGPWTHAWCHTFVRNHVALLYKTTLIHTHTYTHWFLISIHRREQFFLYTCKSSEFCRLYLVVLSYRIIIRIVPSNCMNNFSPRLILAHYRGKLWHVDASGPLPCS